MKRQVDFDNLSPTQKLLVEKYPEGSSPDRDEIKKFYELNSQSKHKRKGCSVRRCKIERGRQTYNYLVGVGFWR